MLGVSVAMCVGHLSLPSTEGQEYQMVLPVV